MKQIAAIIMIAIMLMLSLGAFANDTLNLNLERGATIEQKMLSFETGTAEIDKEMRGLEGRMEYIFSQYGYDLRTMNAATLNELVKTQVRYALGKELLIRGLNQIYFAHSGTPKKSVVERLNDAVTTVTKNCRVIDKIADRCLDKQESLVFQAHYMKLQIEVLDIKEDSLKNHINAVIAQENNSLYL